MNESIILELKNMIKYPSLHRKKIHLWIKTGLWERYTAQVEDLELKDLLKDLYKNEFEKLSVDDLMYLYKRLTGSKLRTSRSISTTLTNNWIRVSPSKRG